MVGADQTVGERRREQDSGDQQPVPDLGPLGMDGPRQQQRRHRQGQRRQHPHKGALYPTGRHPAESGDYRRRQEEESRRGRQGVVSGVHRRQVAVDEGDNGVGLLHVVGRMPGMTEHEGDVEADDHRPRGRG